MSFRLSSRPVLSVIAGVAIVACAGGGGSSSPAASPAPVGVTSMPATPAAAANGLPAGVSAMMVATGDSIFHKASCQRCHGPEAKGTPRGPDLTDATWLHIGGTYPEIVQIVTTGVPKDKIKSGAPFAMNPRGGTNLSDEQISQVAAYVYTLSHK
jgi:mono/diheme cytochrome c family protein